MTGILRALVALLLATSLALVPLRAEPNVEAAAATGETAVFVVRHAEKGKDDPKDPGLTEAGVARAQDLARLLGDAGVTHLFATEYRRTRETLAPLAASTGLDVTTRLAGETDALVRAIRGLPRGSVAVVAGHSNTVPELVRGLGGSVDEEGLVESRAGKALPEAQYDRLFVVILSPADSGKALKTLDLRYGP